MIFQEMNLRKNMQKVKHNFFCISNYGKKVCKSLTSSIFNIEIFQLIYVFFKKWTFGKICKKSNTIFFCISNDGKKVCKRLTSSIFNIEIFQLIHVFFRKWTFGKICNTTSIPIHFCIFYAFLHILHIYYHKWFIFYILL